MTSPREYKFAIVGAGCRLPGGVNAPHNFWKLLVESRCATGEAHQPGARTLAGPPGGMLGDVNGFDTGFFNLSPREAAALDPQHRLLLEVSWDAVNEAGLDVHRWSPARVGVFIGMHDSDFARRSAAVDVYGVFGRSRSAAPGLISHSMGARGPSLSLDNRPLIIVGSNPCGVPDALVGRV